MGAVEYFYDSEYNIRFTKKGLSMKAKSLILAAALGMLASSPAYAWGGINIATFRSRHPAVVQPTSNQAKPEVQVAVLANSSSAKADIKTLCPTASIWYGTGVGVRATHSH